jgi:NitT/TauT family transport system substrate-binding protein
MMSRSIAALVLAALLQLAPAAAETTVKVGWCARTVSAAASPYAIAMKMGWFAERGVKVVLTPLPGSTDCVKQVATGELPFSVPSIEPLAIIHPQGVKARIYYTAYQGFNYGIAVAADSPIKTFSDLRGRMIGVISMDSAGVIVARALVSVAGLDPNTDIRIVVAGEGAQTAALVRSHQVDALSQFDTQYAMVENAGVPLRRLPNGEMAHFPGNGFLALEDTLRTHRAEAVTVARGFAMGGIYALANPEAAIRILYEVFPFTKPIGKDEETAVHDDMRVLSARMDSWRLETGGVKRWGESNVENFDRYIDFLVKWKIVPQKVPANDLVTNDLIDDINTFDAAKIEAMAKSFKP